MTRGDTTQQRFCVRSHFVARVAHRGHLLGEGIERVTGDEPRRLDPVLCEQLEEARCADFPCEHALGSQRQPVRADTGSQPKEGSARGWKGDRGTDGSSHSERGGSSWSDAVTHPRDIARAIFPAIRSQPGTHQFGCTLAVLVLVLALAHSPSRDGIDVDAETQQLSSFCGHLGMGASVRIESDASLWVLSAGGGVDKNE